MSAPAVRPCRVLMVTGAYHPEISSSALQCRDMARLLSGRVDIRVLTTAVDPSLPVEARVDDVAVSRVRVDVSRLVSKVRASLRMLQVLLRVMPWCDIVHIHGVSSKNVLVTAVAKAIGRPVLLSLHTSGHDEATAIRQRGRLAWWAFCRADLYLSVSHGLVQAYLTAGLPPDRIQLVPNGIDTRRFRPADPGERRALRRRLGLAADALVILFVGFFSHDKQPDVLFDAWLTLRDELRIDATLVFVGATTSAYFEVDSALADRMKDEAGRRGVADRVVFAGPTHDIQDYFRAADLFALPSRREGLPIALLEAMACGLPCVASRLPGATDTIIDHERSGLLVPPGDVAALVAALAAVAGDASRAAALGQAARDTVMRRFADADTAAHWLGAYDRLLGSEAP